VDGAMVEGETALKHGDRVQRERDEQQEIIHVVILAETLSPQENRVNRAHAVNRHGEQKEMTVSEPGHGDRLNAEMDGASGNSEVDLSPHFCRLKSGDSPMYPDGA